MVIRSVDLENGVVEIGEIDATDGSPLLDIKPYMPHYGRVRTCRVPDWASGWPAWMPAEGVELDAPPK